MYTDTHAAPPSAADADGQPAVSARTGDPLDLGAARLDEDIHEIDSLAGEQTEIDIRIALDLSDHYGEVIVGSPLPVSCHQDLICRMWKCLEAASAGGYPEKQDLAELFIEFKRQGFARGPVTDRIVESLAVLDDVDREHLLCFVKLYAEPANWQRHVTQEGRYTAHLVEALLTAYPSLREGVAGAPHLLTRS